MTLKLWASGSIKSRVFFVTKVFPLTECNNNSADSAGTVKYKLTGDSIKAQLFTKDCRFSIEEDAQAVLSTEPINDGNLTVSVGERPGLEAEAPGRSRSEERRVGKE